MKELFPIGTGLILGVAFAARTRMLESAWVRTFLIALAGLAATILSGEYPTSWIFAIVDTCEARNSSGAEGVLGFV
ncbi:MAG TPA: hypothetical protein VN812_19880 [Candidatus Acidoferrales bacterium]|nr:hypothetical protein [Candidatus Acidoferrales bacterium]